MDTRFSVLIPIYAKENPAFFNESISSVINQSTMPNEIVIVKDGPLTDELEQVISHFSQKYNNLFKIISIETNQGLGIALSKGVNACSYELVARMDSDDISKYDRFEKQIIEFEKDPNLDICGCQIAEFEGDINNIISHRRVPLNDSEIKHYQKMRSAFNHPSIMFKKSSVLKAGNYPPCRYIQDGLLYVKMFITNAKGKNMPDELLYFRINKEFFQRRGGLDYFLKYKEVRDEMKRLYFISNFEYFTSLILHLSIAIVPSKLRSIIYRKVLHR